MRVVCNDYTAHFEHHPEELRPFPDQLRRAAGDGAFHLGGDGRTDVDPARPGPARECYPAGQGVGGIDALVPAADLVTRFVGEADAELARVGSPMAGGAGQDTPVPPSPQ